MIRASRQVPFSAAAVTAVLALLAACSTAQGDAQRLADAGRPDEALALLTRAKAADSDDPQLRAAYLQQRETVLRELLASADVARREGHLPLARSLADKIDVMAAGDPRATWLREEISRSERHHKWMSEAQAAFDQKQWDAAESAARSVLEEDPGDVSARKLLTRIAERQAARARDALSLSAGSRPITLKLHDATLRSVFEALAHAADLNFVFDKDVRADGKVNIELRDTTVDEAMRIIMETQQLQRKLLSPNSVLIYQNNGQKQREHQEMLTRSFYLVNADAKQVQTLIRTMVKTRDMYVDERLNLLVVRETPEAMRMVQRLIESVDLPEAEVMMDVQVMEVSTDLMRQLGLSWPSSVSYGLVPSTVAGGNPTSGYVYGDVRGSLRAYVSNPLLTATLNGTSGSSNLLAHPSIRARNHDKAHVQLGNKLPVFTTTTTGAGSVSGFIASSVSYIDVGLKLDVEPSVLLDNDIVLKVALEVSSVANQVTGPDGTIAYNVGTRQTSSSLRLKDGETAVLAGLIQDDDRRAAAGVPGLSELPLIGTLFGVRGGTRDKTEVVMLITPHIVRNVTLPPVAAAAIESGTDAEPGVPSLRLTEGKARIDLPVDAPGPGSPAASLAATSAEQRLSPPASALVIDGPGEATAGTSFELRVSNPGPEPVRASLTYDPDVLQSMAAGSASGNLPLQLPPGGSQVVAFKVRPQMSEGSTTLSVDAGGAWTLLIRGAAPPAIAPTNPEHKP